ncbi:MBL fold metallo-hydrolase [Halomicrobium sp. HM KBTZ05]|uniref:MBL fold metallo-hydrolase n=1 Tax=Halomicrobium sp. HM KBTZ05 TaxID=3242663 RepID=UPI003556F929
MGMERISVPVATRAPSGQTNAYVLGRDRAAVIDPCARHERVDDALASRSLAHVLVTHHHPDHVGGVADYAAEHDATVWARRGRESAFEAATGVAPDRTFTGGTEIPVDDDQLRVVETPGHAPEHVAFATGDGLVCGDLAAAAGSVAVGAPEGEMRAYCCSLRRVIARAPDRLFPGHGPVVDDAGETCRRLLAHRLDRERRVEAAVAEGSETLPAITDAAYDKDVESVRDLAEATVAAHLEKLAVEGRVAWDGERARPPSA